MTWSSTLMMRGMSMMFSLCHGALARGRAGGGSAVADEPARAGAAVFAVAVAAAADQLAVHPDLVQPAAAGDEPVRAGRQVPDPLHRLHGDGGGIERDQVGEVAGRDPAPAGDPEDRGRV